MRWQTVSAASPTNAQARFSRRCIPPEYVETGLSALSARFTFSKRYLHRIVRGQEEIGNYRILDKSTGKTESINVGDIDLEKQSPETLKKLLSGQQTEMTNKSGTNSLVTLNKTITGWGISAVKQVFNSADNSAGI